MKKNASDFKPGDTIVIGGEKLKVIGVEISDIGKQGTKKCRIEAQKQNEEKIVIIRPADYPFESS
ncbi:hypothetical protein J4461_03530 [Candidatus Pacearchaeota archaeon]|nr:hypothetical protein [Candidatus Pacearchaeota archaeon]